MDSAYTTYLQEKQSYENTYVFLNFQKHLRVYTSITCGTFFNCTELTETVKGPNLYEI